MRVAAPAYDLWSVLLLSATFSLAACNLFVDTELAESTDENLVSDVPSDDSDGIGDVCEGNPPRCTGSGYGQECGSDTDCPDSFYCAYSTCQDGRNRDFCESESQCSEVDDTCNGEPALCEDRLHGDSCTQDAECPGDLYCAHSLCQDGREGDYCVSTDQCSEPGNVCVSGVGICRVPQYRDDCYDAAQCPEGMYCDEQWESCRDGRMNDPCESDHQCDSDMCCEGIVCWGPCGDMDQDGSVTEADIQIIVDNIAAGGRRLNYCQEPAADVAPGDTGGDSEVNALDVQEVTDFVNGDIDWLICVPCHSDCGDVDSNGSVEEADALMLESYLDGDIELLPCQLETGDVYPAGGGDRELTQQDSTALREEVTLAARDGRSVELVCANP